MDASTIGRRLQRARLAAGLSQAQVSEALGIPRPAVSLVESGQRSVSGVELAKLARMYGKPASSFLFEPEEHNLLAYFRAAAPVTEFDLPVLDEAVDWFRHYASLEQTALGEQRYETPHYPIPRGRAIDQGAYLAEQERRRLGVGVAPIPSLVALLESQGVKVSIRPIPSFGELSGCYFFSPELGPCVLVNGNDPISRRRFTAAHEYAHFLVERDGVRGEVCAISRRREFVEMRANAFAASFLLPTGGVEEFLGGFDVAPGNLEAEHIVHLMFQFGVSYQAVLWRLLNLGWLTEDRRLALEGISSSGLARLLGYEGRDPGDSESEPDRFRTIAFEAWRADEISTGKLAELLGIPRNELRQLVKGLERLQRRPVGAPAAEPDWL